MTARFETSNGHSLERRVAVQKQIAVMSIG
jgi:hypothetical protein